MDIMFPLLPSCFTMDFSLSPTEKAPIKLLIAHDTDGDLIC